MPARCATTTARRATVLAAYYYAYERLFNMLPMPRRRASRAFGLLEAATGHASRCFSPRADQRRAHFRRCAATGAFILSAPRMRILMPGRLLTHESTLQVADDAFAAEQQPADFTRVAFFSQISRRYFDMPQTRGRFHYHLTLYAAAEDVATTMATLRSAV